MIYFLRYLQYYLKKYLVKQTKLAESGGTGLFIKYI